VIHKCQKQDHLLPDYLDGVLNDRDRLKVDKHLAGCAECRASLAMQRKWLDSSARRELKSLADETPAGLDERIMAAIHAGSNSRTAVSRKQRPYFQRYLTSWPRLAGVAAAVIILVAAVQIIPHWLSGNSASLPADYTMAGTGQTERQSTQAANDSSGGTAVTGPVWHVDLNASGDKINTPEESAFPRECFGQIVDEQSGALAEILQDSQDVRFARQDIPVPRTLILAAYDQELIETKLNHIKIKLSTCETPLQIEIIRTDELAAVLDALDDGLFDRIFPETAPSASWIFILIGA